jgi:DNA-binding beta-propeller fold protein YncE
MNPWSNHLGRIVSLVLGILVLGATLVAQPQVSVVMTGLDNPRGLAIGPEGALYVAEAGRGGPGPCGPNIANENRCYGASGAITRLRHGIQERVATGLPSHALVGGSAANGPNDISFLGVGGAYVTMGLGRDPSFRDVFGSPGEAFGTLLQVSASGEWRVRADLAGYEADVNPAAGIIDSNPFGVLSEPERRLVTDAGGNSLLEVNAEGSVSTIVTFPSVAQGRPFDSVPTGLTVGPDGAYYIGELTGAPFPAGAARVYRVVPGSPPQIHLTGFKTIIDLAFDAEGNLYVLQHASSPVFFGGPGLLIRVAPDGTRTTVLANLDRPTSVLVGLEGEIYVTNHGITPEIGEVLRLDF